MYVCVTHLVVDVFCLQPLQLMLLVLDVFSHFVELLTYGRHGFLGCSQLSLARLRVVWK